MNVGWGLGVGLSGEGGGGQQFIMEGRMESVGGWKSGKEKI